MYIDQTMGGGGPDKLTNLKEGAPTVELATAADLVSIAKIWKTGAVGDFESEKQGITSSDIEHSEQFSAEGLEELRKKMEKDPNHYKVWVIRDKDGEVMGFCGASQPVGATFVALDEIHVATKYKGQGLKKKLLEEVFDQEWVKGKQVRIQLPDNGRNEAIVKFYEEEFGFRKVEDPKARKMDPKKLSEEKEMPTIEMVRGA